MISLKGLATGIGSLPYTDAELAVGLVLKYLPEIPFWPQLPKRDVREGMLAQFSQGIPCLRVSPDGLYFDSRNAEKELEIFYEQIIADNKDYFKITPDFALGLHIFYKKLKQSNISEIKFIKCHITGPFTFAAAINDDKGRALVHDEVWMQVILKGLAMKALWQIKFFKELGKKMIVFIDEPYLASFGSAYTPLNREDVLRHLTELTKAIKSDDVLTGIHCCGNTDWSVFTDIPTLDIINFDAFGFMDKFVLYSDNLKKFVERGGNICWGIVPTQELEIGDTVESLVRRLKHGLNLLTKKGLDKKQLESQSLLSPACGLGTLDGNKAEYILKSLSQVSTLFQDSFL